MWYQLTMAIGVFGVIQLQENSRVTSRESDGAKRSPSTLRVATTGTEHGCGLSSRGKAYCWGSNRLGQLGDDGWNKAANAPVAVATSASFSTISAGANHTCALTGDGTVYCWGLNLTGELGQAVVANTCDGFPCSRRPVRLETRIRFDAISAGFGHTCGLSDGQAFCWGRNDEGQLGNSRVDDRCDGVGCTVTPIRVVGIGSLDAIIAGGDHTCGIADGLGYCWGSNQYGQLGAPRTVRRSARPLRLPVDERIASIEARGIYTCAVGESGQRTCWGRAPK